MSWLHRLLRRRDLDAELKRELRFHAEECGASATAGADAVEEACRDVRGTRWAEDLGRDLRHGLRLWRRRPGFAAAVLLTMALGIAATTIMLSLISGVLFKPLAFAHPDSLLRLQEQTEGPPSAEAVAEGWGNIWAVANPNYQDLIRQSHTMELGAWNSDTGLLSAPGAPEVVNADDISPSLLPLLGIAPMAGRYFAEQDDHIGAAPVAILAASEARKRFGSADAAIGRDIRYGGKLRQVVGVMPPGFDLHGFLTPDAAQIYFPLGQFTSPAMQNRGRHFLTVVARLRPGASAGEADQELDAIAHRLQHAYPKTNSQRVFLLQPWRADVGAATSTSLWLLLAAAGLILLLACVNIACLLLTRALARERELAMQAALGASRARLTRQCLTEAGLFGLGGGLLGIALAAAGLPTFVANWPGGLPRAADAHLDWSVLLFALASALICGLIFGLAPACRLRLHAGDFAVRGNRAIHVRSAGLQRSLVGLQLALAVVLLAGAAIMGRTLIRLDRLDLGLQPQNVLAARVMLPDAIADSPALAQADWQSTLQRLRAVPGVVAAATVDTVPLREGNDILNYWTGASPPPESQQPSALATTVSPQYFRVLGIDLLRGRVIAERDRKGTPPVAVIDENLARHAFGVRDPLGQAIHLGLGNDPLTVIGVVRHVKYWGPAGDAASPVQDEIYYAFAQLPDRLVPRWSQLTSIVVRTGPPPDGLLPAIQTAVQGPAGDQAMYETVFMPALARQALSQQRFLMLVFSLFAGLALLLSSIGIYGVQAWMAAQRLPELAVRLALGARRPSVFWLQLRQGLFVAAAGALVGVLAALGAARVLERRVAGVESAGLTLFVVIVAVLLLTALAAGLGPAWRASRADPAQLLRLD